MDLLEIEYREYVRECLDDDDFLIQEMEDYHTWADVENCKCESCRAIKEGRT